jgi:ubiquinone biosynthesis protein
LAKWFTTFTRPFSAAVRSQQIALLLSRYGVAGSLASLGVEAGKRGLKFAGVGKQPNARFDAVFGKNLALTFAKLGPTFIKLGQILASRPDLVGDTVSDELRMLFSKVPPIPFRVIKRTLKEELGREKFKKAFKSIETKAMAAASISQIHKAVLTDGTPVILKVQRKGVAKTIVLDLYLLEGFARSMHLLYPKLQLLQIFQDFKQATLLEIDYLEEAKNIDRFTKNYRKILSGSPDVLFPKYYPDLTTRRVIALEPMRGRSVAELKKGSTVARVAAEQSLAAVLEQIFDHGFFHADPHAGNLFFQEDAGQLGFIDLGLVGQLQPEDKKKFLKVVLAILKRDRGKLASSLFALGMAGKKSDYKKFEASIQELLDETKAQGVQNAKLEKMVTQLLAIARKNDLHIPNRYIMMIRSCLIVEGVAKSLDPNLSVFQVATPIVARSLMRSYNPLSIFWRK